jgi:hypothetical protein
LRIKGRQEMKFELTIQEDMLGDLFIELPKEIIEELNLVEGDTILWTVEGDRCILTKKVEQ